jgi:hypothetical protein
VYVSIFNSRRFFLFWCSAGKEGETDRRSFGHIFETLDTFYFSSAPGLISRQKIHQRKSKKLGKVFLRLIKSVLLTRMLTATFSD